VVRGGRGGHEADGAKEVGFASVNHVTVGEWHGVQQKRQRECGRQLSEQVDGFGNRTRDHEGERGVTAGAWQTQHPREAVNADHATEQRHDLHKRESISQVKDFGEQRDQLVNQRRVGDGREAGVPAWFPRVEPGLGVV
jgi:hypothetical protein